MNERYRARALTLLVLAVSTVTGCTVATVSSPSPSPHTTPATPRSEALATADGWIAYQSVSPRGPDGIFLVRPDGSDQHEILLDVPGRRLHPDFSPDGTMLAFDQQNGGADQTYIAASDGSAPRLIAPCDGVACLQIWEPAWSPDGTRLAVSTTMSGSPWRMGIAIVDVATGEITQVEEHDMEVGQDHFPRWSPDGTHLVFWRGSATADGGDCAVFGVETDGDGLVQLTDTALVAGDPDFSPDGTRILFGTHPALQYGQGRSELYTMAPDGTDVREITHFGEQGPRAVQPRWTPDGSAIVYTRTVQGGHPSAIYAMASDGTKDGPVADSDPVYTHPVVQPTP